MYRVTATEFFRFYHDSCLKSSVVKIGDGSFLMFLEMRRLDVRISVNPVNALKHKEPE